MLPKLMDKYQFVTKNELIRQNPSSKNQKSLIKKVIVKI